MLSLRVWFRTISLQLLCAYQLFNMGCSLIVDSDRHQCTTDNDCKLKGTPFTGMVCQESICREPSDWSCLGSVVWPAAQNNLVTATLYLKDLVTDEPVAGVSARICRKLDTTCNQPITAGLTSDAAGALVVQVQAGFDGYVELSPSQKLRGSYYFYPPLTSDRKVPYVPLLPLSSLSSLAGLGGTQLLADRGHVFLGTYNCLSQPAAGVRLRSNDFDASTTPFYLIKRIPSMTATSTDSDGRGGVLNLRPGSVSLRGELASGESIGTVSVYVRPGEVTYTTLLPAPI